MSWKPYGWDERDYKLASAVRRLPSYGLLPNDDRMVSMREVIAAIVNQAETRGNDAVFGRTRSSAKEGR